MKTIKRICYLIALIILLIVMAIGYVGWTIGEILYQYYKQAILITKRNTRSLKRAARSLFEDLI